MKMLCFKLIATPNRALKTIHLDKVIRDFDRFISKLGNGEVSLNQATIQFSDYQKRLDAESQEISSTNRHAEFASDLLLFQALCEFHVARQEDRKETRVLAACDRLIALKVGYLLEMESIHSHSVTLFKQSLPNDLLAYKAQVEQVLHARLSNGVEKGLEDLFDSVFWGHPLTRPILDVLPVCMPELSESAKQTLTIFYNALFPNNSSSVSYDSQFLSVLLRFKGIETTPDCLSIFLPKATPVKDVTSKMLRLPHSVSSVMTRLRGLVDARILATSGFDQSRWRVAQYRIDELVDVLGSHSIAASHVEKVVTILSSFYREWQKTCSVGIDLQAVDLKSKICATVLPDTNRMQNYDQERLHAQLLPAIQFRLQEVLRTVLPEDFAVDVHHINLLMCCIYAKHKMSIPESLSDPFNAGMRDVILRNASQLVARFSDPKWLFEALVSMYQDTHHIDTLFSEAQTQLGSLIRVDASKERSYLASRMAVIESTMQQRPMWILDQIHSAPDKVRELHNQLDGHGLLGLAAKSEQYEIFEALLGMSLESSIVCIDRDEHGYTLLDYAVLGGHVSIVTPYFTSLAWDELLVALNQGDQRVRTPTILALAAESQNPLMIELLSTYLTPAQLDAMFHATDSRGYTPLMHAAATGKSSLLQALYTLHPTHVCSSLEARNSDGQTALILASAYAKSSETVAWLLSCGANPNAKVQDADGIMGYSVLDIAMLDGDSSLMSTLLADARTEINIDLLSSLARSLLKYNPNQLKEILLVLPYKHLELFLTYDRKILEGLVEHFPTQVGDILVLKDHNGDSIARHLTLDMESFSNILSKLPSEYVPTILSQKKCEKFLIIDLLALRYEHEVFLKKILKRCTHDQTVQLLGLRGGCGIVAHAMVQHAPYVLKDILQGFTFDYAKQVLGLNDRGVTVEKRLEEYNVFLLNDIQQHFLSPATDSRRHSCVVS